MAPSNAYLGGVGGGGQHSMMTIMDGSGGPVAALPSMPGVSMHLHMTQHHHHHWSSTNSVASSGGTSSSSGQMMDGRQQQQDDDSGGEFSLYFNNFQNAKLSSTTYVKIFFLFNSQITAG